MEVMAAFEHAAIAIAEMNSLRPDVVLVNSTLPDMPGFEACVRLMDATPPPRVIMMCLSMTDAEIFAGRMAGAAGCLTIDGAVEDLVRTVRANGRGEMFHIRSVSESALRFAQYRPRYVDISLLTDRQKQVMGLVADGFNNGAIAAVLGLTSYTARNYMNSVLGKLGIASRAEIGGTRLTPRGAEHGQRRGREPAVFGWLVGHLTSAEHLQRDVESVNGGGKTYHWDVEVQGKYPVKCSA
jgi:DNA-binding NarL/FixJ family response regulator